jgi:hypothetical protein
MMSKAKSSKIVRYAVVGLGSIAQGAGTNQTVAPQGADELALPGFVHGMCGYHAAETAINDWF